MVNLNKFPDGKRCSPDNAIEMVEKVNFKSDLPPAYRMTEKVIGSTVIELAPLADFTAMRSGEFATVVAGEFAVLERRRG